MKKKLITYILSILIFSVIVITLLFSAVVNYQYEQNMKDNLKINNDMIIKLIQTNNIKNKELFFKNNIGNKQERVSIINKNGNVEYDSIADVETTDNHNNRKEIIMAREHGEGYSIRYSQTVNKNMMYYAKKFGDGYVIRSSMAMENINGVEGNFLRYYIYIVVFTIILALILSIKMSYIILSPVKDLQEITSRISKGELNKRVKIFSNDEIGQLGKTFNEMADQLESTIRDAVDKQNRLQAILTSMDSGVIAVDKEYKVIMINPYAEKIFGITKDVIGKSLIKNIRDFEMENIFKERTDKSKEIKILWPKERELRIKTADIINFHELIGRVAVVQDVTDIKKLENMRTQFVANVSHELKTPLTSIKGFAETLRYVEDRNQREKFLNIIDEEVNRLTDLIKDILILSDIEQCKKCKREDIDVNKLVEDVYMLLKTIADKKNIKVLTDLKELPKIKGDRNKVKQMIINLVENAVKYSEEGDSVYIITKYINDNVIISIKDTGIGIEKNHIPRLFERFYRVDKARLRSKGGTGLGLAIVKHIVMNLKGNIEVKSKVGEGSEFIVTIPLKENHKIS